MSAEVKSLCQNKTHCAKRATAVFNTVTCRVCDEDFCGPCSIASIRLCTCDELVCFECDRMTECDHCCSMCYSSVVCILCELSFCVTHDNMVSCDGCIGQICTDCVQGMDDSLQENYTCSHCH